MKKTSSAGSSRAGSGGTGTRSKPSSACSVTSKPSSASSGKFSYFEMARAEYRLTR